MKRYMLYALFLTTSMIFGATSPDELSARAKGLFGTLPKQMPGSEKDTPELVALGEKLYFDNALSVNDSQSCNSCHRVDNKMGGVDNEATSPGAFKKRGDRNSPTTLNAGFQFTQFWDGRAADLFEQAKGPILNPVEMAMPSEEAVVKKLSAIPAYPKMFAKAFPGQKKPLTYDNLAHAIAAFERTLITHDRFDDFQNGDATLNSEERKGLELFMSKGCISCHMGPLLGGSTYQKMGLIHPYENKEDKGRYNVTKQAGQEYWFKVPTLRNIKLTAPYFHDGSAKTLEDAVRTMGWIQLNQKLSDQEVSSIVAFLGSLTDKEREK